jgi:hypothetical protein
MSDCNCSICKEMDNFIEKPDAECPICFETISSEINTVITECGHKFHCKCLMQNAMHNGFGCPYCRTEMTYTNKNTNIIEDDYYEMENDNNNEDIELEEGEIIRTEFQEFVDRQNFRDEMRDLPYSLTSFRMFQQRIQGEEVEEELDEELQDRLDEERRERRNMRDANIIIEAVSRFVTKEDLIKSMLYGSFGHETHQEVYMKAYGKVKGTIISINRYSQETRPIRIYS